MSDVVYNDLQLDWYVGLNKEEREVCYFSDMLIDTINGRTHWLLVIPDETPRWRESAKRVRTLEPLEIAALNQFQVDLIHTAEERDAVWS